MYQLSRYSEAREATAVYRLTYNEDVVAFKMDRLVLLPQRHISRIRAATSERG